MSSVDLGALLESSGAVLRGHFLLTSGRHSDVYFEKFRVLERPDVLSALCTEIAAHFKGQGIELVAGPTTGGIIIAFEVARQMGLPAIYVESENGVKTLRRGASIATGAKVLVVDDVLTTGRSVFEVIEVVGASGGKVSGVGVLIDRAQSPIDFGCPTFSAYKVEAESYGPDEVPEWLAAIPIQKPGTRAI
jgi:orotate phosphoribosyltransferase